MKSESGFSLAMACQPLEYLDSPLKVLTDSGGRMIPEELDKALDNVKAGGKVSYHVSHRRG